MNRQLPSIPQAKEQARQLRAQLAEAGTAISHAMSLERVAQGCGFRDWNTMCAAQRHGAPGGWAVGDTVRGRYLSQPFTARIISVSPDRPGWFRLVLHLDVAVDVVTSKGFSNFRTRIRGVIGPKGHTLERTSDGQPHLQIDPG